MEAAAPDDAWDDLPEPLVRPYAVTAGRTGPAAPLMLLALVSTTVAGQRALWERYPLEPEARAIAVLCVQIHSIAEIGAHLHLPLVVVQVLVDDLQRAGIVSVHRPPDVERPGRDLLKKVLDGLVRL
ncbi:DUF742 domain-containing protein [Dactylosporangium sp. AC04546]|uniref:DUF742 domain-containing protein n=1 Tax=Dactylosporangium sp. AC04546 TaxID=2862460 RepID=UPI001EDDA0F8|nr:DUF742 domain-containing protein [Dactylosporangium sp. AC04546]WVK89083.1 DUF742 domain-containing protein [Dactylosporangium sp. AC04546]